MATVKLLITGDGTDKPAEFPSGIPVPPPHWSNIDEDPADDDTTFIETDDTLTLRSNCFLKQTLSLPAGATIDKVTVLARVRRAPNPTWPTTPTGDVGFLIAGVDYFSGVSIDPPSTYADYTRDFATNPATVSAWTESDVNGAEAQIKGNSSRVWRLGLYYYSFYRVTQVYLIVTYTVPVVVKIIGEGLTWVVY